MSAGSDFPSALKKVAEGQTGVVAEEFRQVLFSLELGMTRRAALLALEKRAPVSEVSDLVKAIILAEQKGASVADALVAQARTSRQRRSVRAEESAAQAGVLLIGPLMLLVGCILILLVGPLIMASSAL
jgi:tight adherence protein C